MMKKLIMCLMIISVSFGILAQVPERMSHQIVIRNAGGAVVKNQVVSMQISILQGSPSGTPVYVETHTPTTNANGLASLEIGGGTVVTGTFSAINWAEGPYFLKTEADPTGGTSYTIAGTSQLLSVPYALSAKTATTAIDAVTLTGNQFIVGNKTFTGITKVPTPVNATDAATKEYVDALRETIYDELLSLGLNGLVKDIDGNIYKTLKIGEQIWMTENLKTTHYSNGDAINLVTANTWGSLTSGAYCWYNNDETTYKNIYGALYNWYPVVDSRKICPTGWHVPSDEEWKTLEMYLGLSQVEADETLWRGTDQGNKLKENGNVHWKTPSAGNNSSGFTALPGGGRGSEGQFFSNGDNGYWWSSTEGSSTTGWARYLFFDYSQIYRNHEWSGKIDGFSVRCVKGNVGGTIPTNGLVAYYPFNGNANDESGNSNNGTNNGASLTNDRFGNENKAYFFNGSDNTIDFGDFHPNVNNFSISIWFNALTFSNQRMLISDATTQSGFDIDAYSDIVQFATQSPYLNGNPVENVAVVNCSLNQWHHFVGTSLNGTLQIYLDGILSSTQSGPLGTIGSGILAAGFDKTCNCYFYNGSLDDIRFYDHILTQAEVDALYHEGGW